MPTLLEEKIGQWDASIKKVDTLLSAKRAADGRYDLTPQEVDEVRTENTKMLALGKEVEALRIVEQAGKNAADARKSFDNPTRKVPHPFGQGVRGGDGSSEGYEYRKSIGEAFIGGSEFKSLAQRGKRDVGWTYEEWDPYALKTTFATTAGWDPFVTRLPGYVASPQQMPRVIDIVPLGETTQHSIKWMLETTFTNAAAETSEGSLYPEATLALTEQLTAVNKVAVFLPVTDEQLADEPQSRDYLNSRLDLMLRQRLDQQLLTGNGTAPNIRGFDNISGVQTQAKGTDPTFDAMLKAMVLVQTVGFANPTGFIVNPTDWQNTVLTRTSQGLYILGNPGDGPATRMWGLPVVSTTYRSAGTMTCADFAGYTQLFYRKGIDFLVSNSHSDFFQRGQLAVRADMRVALVVYRPKAICNVTGTF